MRVANSLYKIEFDGLDFSEAKRVEGLKLITGDSKEAYDFFGRTYNTTLTITRTFCDTDLARWITEIRAGTISKKNGSIMFLDESNNTIVGFKLTGCWPISWTGPDMIADMPWSGKELGEETVTFAIEQVAIDE